MPGRGRRRNRCHTCIAIAVVRITPAVAGPPQPLIAGCRAL